MRQKTTDNSSSIAVIYRTDDETATAWSWSHSLSFKCPFVRTVLKCTHIIHASILPSPPLPSTPSFPSSLSSSSLFSPFYIVTICADSSAHTHNMQITPTISPHLFSSLLNSSNTLFHHPTPSDMNMSHTTQTPVRKP